VSPNTNPVDRAATTNPEPLITRKATRSGIPNLRQYLAEVWRYRAFAYHWSKADVKARNFETFLGRLWHYINPVLFGLIYFVFVGIISGGGLTDAERLALIVGNLYLWVFFSSVIISGTTSVSSGTAGITAQSSIPRVILPTASMITAANLFIRSMVAYIPFHLLAGRGLYPQMLWIPLLIVLTGLFGFGISLVFAVVNVYVRDISRLLPHLTRLWMYLSPVIWAYSRVFSPDVPDTVRRLAEANPMFSGMAAWTMALGGVQADQPTMVSQVLIFFGWATVTAVLGFLFFVSREDEFAIRG
jgi:ABC-type polysaccharide/polyol phosphate export permease